MTTTVVAGFLPSRSARSCVTPRISAAFCSEVVRSRVILMLTYWTVEELAKRIALSPSRFAARFRASTGESVMRYVGRWRANVACRLLRDTNLPLSQIAGRVGYESFPA